MDLENLAISQPTALRLKDAGLIMPSWFSYYRMGDEARLKPTSGKRSWLAYAYTASELMALLPGGLEVDKHTYIVKERSWALLSSRKLNYNCAHLHLVSAPGGAYIAAYYHFNRMIAFSRNEEGKYRNLLFAEENPAEALAQMVLALLREERMASLR